jgi:uncharacterized protein YjbI with pentapeptide repeats
LTHTTLHLTRFVKANCYDAKFLGATLVDCDYLEANLNAAQFDPGAHP